KYLSVPHNQPPRLLHIVKPVQRPEASHILFTRIRRQLKGAAQLVRMIAQDAEDGHKIAVDVVVDFYGRRQLVQQYVRCAAKRLDIRAVRRKVRDDPPPTVTLTAVVGDDGTH